MANPITWQNVTAPSNDDAMYGMELARKGISDGFNKFGSIIKDQQVVNQGVIDRATFATEQDYLNALDGAKSVDALTALRNSGALDQRFAALGAPSQAKVRGAADARLLGLQQQDDASYARDRTRTRNVVADRLSAVTDQTVLANAQSDAQLQPGAAALKASVQQVATRQTADTLDDQRLSDALAAAATEHQVKQQTSLKQLGAVAYGLKLPVDQFGAPDMANITKDQRAMLDASALRLGAPSTEQVFAGDTKRGNAFITDAAKSGAFSAATLARNQASILGKFNSTGVGALVGNDKANVDNAAAQKEVRMAELDSTNRYAPGSKNALTAYEELAVKVDGMFGPNEQEDKSHVQGLLQDLSIKGIEVSPGKFITPSAQDVLAAVRSTKEGWFFNRGRKWDIEDRLKKDLSGSDVTQLLKDSEESKIYQRQKAVKALLNPVKADTKK